jgi:hypothetical protein
MAHVLELAASGRSKCRGCGKALPKGEVRFGERLANPFAEGEMTHWFHPMCAAFKRPDVLLEGLASTEIEVPEREALERAARAILAQPRLARIDGAERSPSSQARCRHCREPIEKGAWRIRLVFHEEGTFSPGGYVHVGCRVAYFEAVDMTEAVLHFSAALDAAEQAVLRSELAREPAASSPAPSRPDTPSA